MKLRAPWQHETIYRLAKGRTEEIQQDLAITQPQGTTSTEPVKTKFSYLRDGRLEAVDYADGGRDELEYADHGLEPTATGGPDTAPIDRLQLLNVTRALRKATTPESQGTSAYAEIDVTATYQEDNQVSSIVDGLGRGVDLAVPVVGQTAEARYRAEGIAGRFQYDAYGRVKRADLGGGTANASSPLATSTSAAEDEEGANTSSIQLVSFGKDRFGKKKAGLPSIVGTGKPEAPATWASLSYNEFDQVDEVKTSQGTETDLTYDEWDRVVRSVSGLSDGRLEPLGGDYCTEGLGAREERGFDAAGHIVRERRLQDFINDNNQVACRWVETRYSYNAREQLVSRWSRITSATHSSQGSP